MTKLIFYILLDKDIDREEFARILLHGHGIQTANAYVPPIHKQEIFQKYINNESFDVADDILDRHISLPMYITLTENDIQYITNEYSI